MIDVNIVYQHVRPEEGVAIRKGSFRVVWSRVPLEDMAFHAYLGAFNYVAERNGAPRVLVQGEPVVTQPGEYTSEIFGEFDRVFTTVTSLVDIGGGKFIKWDHPSYDGPEGMYPPMPNVNMLRERYPLEGRMRGISMILGNKTSKVPCEIYSRRKPAMDWFFEHSMLVFDAYGRPPFMGLNYRGDLRPDEKLEVMAGYRWNLCMENVHDPFWSAGYMTERVPQCFESRTVPIYLGCHDVERRVPPETFVDLRRFKTWKELDDFLTSRTDAEHVMQVDAIDAWVADGNLTRLSIHRFYDQLLHLWAEFSGNAAGDIVQDAGSWVACGMPDVPAKCDLKLFRTWDQLKNSDFALCEAMASELRAARVRKGDAT